MKCFVNSCDSDFHTNIVRPYRFPKSENRRNAWLQSIVNAEDRIIVHDAINFQTARVCSKHFDNESFNITKNQIRLTKTAVPTLFGTNTWR